MCKPLGVSLHAVSNGAAPAPAVLPATAVLPAYSTLPLMPGFLGAPHPAAATPSAVTHTHTAAADWNTYYYVSFSFCLFSFFFSHFQVFTSSEHTQVAKSKHFKWQPVALFITSDIGGQQ